jgi:hypothetical protein
MDDPGGFDSVHLRHADVHQDHIGSELAGHVHGFGPVRGFPDRLDVGV